MIKTVIQKVVPVLLVTYIAGFFFLFCFFLIFPPAIVLSGMHINYIFQVSYLYFIDLLIPITCTGLLIAYSLFLTEDDMLNKRGSTHPFHRAVMPMLFLLLICSIIYAFLITWSYSLTLRSVNSMQHNTQLVNNYIENAEQWEKQGKYHEALQVLEASILIDYHNKKARELRDKIQNFLVKNNLLYQDAAEATPKPEDDGLTVAEMYKKARNFFYKEDWFSAFYYASLAYKIDPEQTGAEELAQDAMQRITAYALSIEDTARKDFFIKKQNGYLDLVNKKYIPAYYTFNELNKVNPADPDIVIYLETSRKMLKNISFFYEDCLFPLSLPGIEDIFFINYNSSGKKEFVSIKKMVNYNFQYFFEGIEVISVDNQGEIGTHFKAKYGKYYYADMPVKAKGIKTDSVHHILMQCISKDNRDLVFKPEYLVPAGGDKEAVDIFQIAADPAWLGWFTIHPNKYRSIGINELFDMQKYLSRFGYPEKEVNIEILMRLTLPFLFLVYAVFSIACGWLYRSRYETRPPLITIILIPLLPVIIGIICKLLFFLNRIFIIFSINMFGFILTIVIGSVLLFILLLAAIFMIAGMVSI